MRGILIKVHVFKKEFCQDKKNVKRKFDEFKQFRKTDLDILNLTDSDIIKRPWEIRKIEVQEIPKIKTIPHSIYDNDDRIIQSVEIDELDYDDPLMSSILDTSEPHEWLKNGRSLNIRHCSKWNKEDFLDSPKKNGNPFREYLNNKNEFKRRNYYGFKDKAMSEGSWALDGILMPLKFADRILKDIRLFCPEKPSDASKSRRNENKENEGDVSQLYVVQRDALDCFDIVKTIEKRDMFNEKYKKKTDSQNTKQKYFKIGRGKDVEKRLRQWEKKCNYDNYDADLLKNFPLDTDVNIRTGLRKTNQNKRKLFRMLKDIYDDIFKARDGQNF
ncbi:hypothetical protein C2G38_2172520 [Gigaspora rosea]|uniref:Uncharacterized protein n=1 Tax=Gigaspora rosea TaxID=44941 RepID=A0A397VKE5_9GLOM|nr:hypothetical protein C2G38_2172520 [Gigaspora rosea]